MEHKVTDEQDGSVAAAAGRKANSGMTQKAWIAGPSLLKSLEWYEKSIII